VDAFEDGWDDGQTVGPTLLVTIVDGGEQIVRDVVDAVGVEGHWGGGILSSRAGGG
jgi:hypothetical protein